MGVRAMSWCPGMVREIGGAARVPAAPIAVAPVVPAGTIVRVINPWYALLAIIWMAMIVTISSIPRIPAGQRQPLVEQGLNLSHFFLYAVFAILVALALSGRRPHGGIRHAGIVTFVAVALFAVSDEWHQSLVPGRSASLGDLTTDLAGLSAALLLMALVRGRGDRR